MAHPISMLIVSYLTVLKRWIRRIRISPKAPRTKLPPLPSQNFGGAPINIADRDALYDVMDDKPTRSIDTNNTVL